MSNFEWDNIEKKASRKKYITMIVIFITVALFVVYYNRNIQKAADIAVVREELLKENASDIDKTLKKDISKMVYTVKIGRFLDFDMARDFILKNNIETFNIYKEDNDIYVNLGPVRDFDKVQTIKDNFIKNGYPAIVELYEEREQTVKELEKVTTDKAEINKNLQDNQKNNEVITEKQDTMKQEINNPAKEAEEKTKNVNKINKDSDGVFIHDPLNRRSGYTIQVAAFRELNDANMTKNKLRFSGIDPLIINEGGYYKVQIGLFQTRKEAEDFVRKYDKSVIPDFYIKKVER